MNRVLDIIQGLCGRVEVRRGKPAPGDVRHTAADTSVAVEHLGYRPQTPLAEGLAAMVASERARDTALTS
jgi:nucleoside-diphosphate-sugar epimerase